MTNATNGETFALETRAEELTYLSGARRVRRGESDRLEVGSGPAQDIVSGTEHTRVGGHLSEHTGGNLSTQVSRMETTVEGKLTLRLKTDTTLLGGAMTDVQTGGVFIGAGMSDDMIIGGGVRVSCGRCSERLPDSDVCRYRLGPYRGGSCVQFDSRETQPAPLALDSTGSSQR